jgi:hypothetical protein
VFVKITLLLVVTPLLAASFYHSSFTEIGLEMSWEQVQRDFLMKRTLTTRTDFVKNQRMVARFALSILTVTWFAVLCSSFFGG